MTPTDPEVAMPDVPLRELEQRWSLSRNGLKARARALGVELERLSSTATVWPAEFLDLGDQLDAHIKSGKPMATFPGLAPAGSAISKPPVPSSPVAADAFAQLVAEMVGRHSFSLPGNDPLKRAKGLADAADNALVLTTDELAALGVKGIDGFSDGDLAYGYCFRRHQQRNRTLWTVQRAIARPADSSVTALPPPQRSVGFGAAIEARCQIMGNVVLPRFNAD